jgi:hypothetical protein
MQSPELGDYGSEPIGHYEQECTRICNVCEFSLYKGLVPGLQRQVCFSSIRLGLYDDFKEYYYNLLCKGTYFFVPKGIKPSSSFI